MFGSASLLPDYVHRLYSAYTAKPEKPKVVVVGYGWAGAAFTSNLDKTKYNVRVISSRPRRLNQPEMIHDLQATYKSPPSSLTMIEDDCISVEEDKKQVVGRKAGYKYDYLVVASGGQPNDFNIPGVKENCILFHSEHQLEEVKAMAKSSNKISIVGAGPTGIELAFKLKSQSKAPVYVLEATSTILPGFHTNLRNQVLALMKQKDIHLLSEEKIQSVTQKDGATYLKTINTEFVTDGKPIWTCGIKPSNFMLTVTKNPTPDAQLQLKPNIWAIGDSIRGHGPPTAQNAEQQGKYLAEHFNTKFKNTEPYKFREFARVLDLDEEGLLIEKNGHVVKLPSAFRKIFYALID